MRVAHAGSCDNGDFVSVEFPHGRDESLFQVDAEYAPVVPSVTFRFLSARVVMAIPAH